MKSLGLNEVREKFLSFFESKSHLRMSSFSLVPQNDNSLLLINSGMAPLKPYFTGQETPPSKRVATCQKCIRTGDIDNVGKTARHGTFFEMLGDFSFGDYFKEEIIPWSWEFVTEVLEIPADRLYVSVYLDDDEAYNIWREKVGIPTERIFRMGKEDNFWEVGLGPCGPCSEIYVDKGEKYGCGRPGCTVGCDCDRYVEIWNLVFTQFNKEEDGGYTDLPKPNIDTGMGLERVAAVMQDVDSIFDVDTVAAIRNKVCEIAGVTYMADAKKDVSIRVITDHARSMTFMTADGVLPANDGRGYVLKRLLRRAARHGKLLGIEHPFLADVARVVVDMSKGAYPELIRKQEYIYNVISLEEGRFYETLGQGIEILKGQIEKMKAGFIQVLRGAEAFKLYDTYGFPLELVKEILAEEGFGVDEQAFREEMEAQRNRARSAREASTYMGAEETVYDQITAQTGSERASAFVGYDRDTVEDAGIIALIVNGSLADTAAEGDKVSVVLETTPLYAESGGQAGDRGEIVAEGGVVDVSDCVKVAGGRMAHIGVVKSGRVGKTDRVTAKIDVSARMDTARNHSATHLLHAALREALGRHVEQAGSLVTDKKLRFDFTHFQAMTSDELRAVESRVNEKILEGMGVDIAEKTMEEAMKAGAIALFGEKYGQTVRVVNMGGYSAELCGGTHVRNTAQIGTFKLLTETSAAAGVRRIEALTGRGALAYYRDTEEKMQAVGAVLKAGPENIINQIKLHMQSAKEARQELDRLRAKMAGSMIDDVVAAAEDVAGVRVVAFRADGMEGNALREMGDQIRDRLKSGIILLVGVNDGKASMLAMVTDDVVKKGANAGLIVKEAVAVIGGKGGGRPNMAMAGGKDVSKIQEAFGVAKDVIKDMLKQK